MIGIAREHMKTQQLHQVLNAVWAVVADANRYFAREAPWALAKTDPKRQGTVLYVTAEVLRCVAILAQPFVPSSAAKLARASRCSARGNAVFDELDGTQRIAPGATLPPPAPVFPRYVEPEATKAPDNACRQPLPSGFSRFRHRARRGGGAGARRRHRPHRHDLDPRASARAGACRWPRNFPTVFCSVGTHPHNAARGTRHRRQNADRD